MVYILDILFLTVDIPFILTFKPLLPNKNCTTSISTFRDTISPVEVVSPSQKKNRTYNQLTSDTLCIRVLENIGVVIRSVISTLILDCLRTSHSPVRLPSLLFSVPYSTLRITVLDLIS